MKEQVARAVTRIRKLIRRQLRAQYGLLLLVLTPILLFACYQVRLGQTVQVGVLTDDKPYVVGMHEPEQADFGAYRWTMAESTIRLPGLGAGPYRVTLTMAGSANPQPQVAVGVNGQALQTFNLQRGLAEYVVEVPASAVSGGDLLIAVQAKGFSPPGDRRQLGVVLHRVVVTPTGDPGILLPPDSVGGWLWGLALLAYLLATIAGFGPLGSGLTGGAVALGSAALLLVNRPWLTVWIATGGLPRAALYGLALCILLRLALPWLYRLAGLSVPGDDLRWPVLLATIFFIAHFGGDLHPHTRVVDLGFHANRYNDVHERGYWLIRVESREWGTRDTVYPPTGYFFMRLVRPLMPDVRGTIVLFIAISEALRLCLVYLIARRATASGLASALAITIFGIVPMAYLPFSWGIATNLFGTFWLTALFGLLTLGYDQLRRPAVALLLTLTVALALLSHPGEFVLSLATVGGAAVLFGLAVSPRFRGSWPILVGLTALAGLIAFAALYRHVAGEMLTQGGETLRQKLGGGGGTGSQPGWRVGGAIDDPIIGLKGYRVTTIPELVTGGLWGYFREALGYYTLWPVLAALAALPLMRGTRLLERLRLTSLLWWLVAAFFALAGLLLNVYVRYALYLLPVIAIGAGLALAWLWRSNRLGQVVVALLVAGTTGYGLWFWYLRISVDGH